MHRERSRLADGGRTGEIGAKEFECRVAFDGDARGAQRDGEIDAGAEAGDVDGLRGARDGPRAETGGEDSGQGAAEICGGEAAENGMNLEAGAGCGGHGRSSRSDQSWSISASWNAFHAPSFAPRFLATRVAYSLSAAR